MRSRATWSSSTTSRGVRGQAREDLKIASGNSSVDVEHPAWDREVAGSNPVSRLFEEGVVAQLAERCACTAVVVGSTPTDSINLLERSSDG